jgi:3-oxoacyl-(acyl-carrier-protein) synthase
MCGFAALSEGASLLRPNVDSISEVMRRALADARQTPSDIDYLNAHGTGTRLGDLAETQAIKAVFGSHAGNPPISSTKSMHGHAMGASGALGAIVCIEAIRKAWIPPTIGLDDADPECDLDYVPNRGRSSQLTGTMSNSFGLGGLYTSTIYGTPRAG